jgi:anti-sigma-K factor RskA
MSRAHDEWAALAPGFALGVLDPEDHAAFAEHLSGCLRCAADVRALDGVTDAVMMATASRTPPPHVRAQLLDACRPRPRLSVSAYAAAAAVVLAAGLAWYQADWQAQPPPSSVDNAVAAATERERVSELARGVLTAPDLARIDLAGQPVAPAASARALWSRERGLVFTAERLPALPPGRVYQVWVVTADAAVSAGLMVPDASGSNLSFFATPRDIAPPVAVAVTIEPVGGVPAPTGDKYLIGTPIA